MGKLRAQLVKQCQDHRLEPLEITSNPAAAGSPRAQEGAWVGFGHLQRRPCSVLGSSATVQVCPHTLIILTLWTPAGFAPGFSAQATLGLSAWFSPRAISSLAVHKVF